VEAIPMEVLNTVNMSWETVGQYMDGRVPLRCG
jgi:hypothetical protein